MISGAGGTYELFEPDQCLAYRVVGGSQLIPIRLAERLGDRVLLGAPARGHPVVGGGRRDRSGVRAGASAGRDRRHPAQPDDRDPLPSAPSRGACAWSRPCPRAASSGCSRSTSSRSGARRVFGPGFRAVRTRARAVRQLAVRVGGRRDDVSRRRERRGSGQDERRRPPRGRARGIAKYIGPRGLRPVGFIEIVWSAEEWTRGAYGTSYGVGGLTRFGEDLRRSIGPIHWACTDIAGVGHIHMEARSAQAGEPQGVPGGRTGAPRVCPTPRSVLQSLAMERTGTSIAAQALNGLARCALLLVLAIYIGVRPAAA